MKSLMYFRFIFKILITFLLVIVEQLNAGISKEIIELRNLSARVEIIKDRLGISHIYAQNQKDLFFAQGFNAARDRLFQLEIWRRQATGTMAEILGSKAIKQDIGSSLLKVRLM